MEQNVLSCDHRWRYFVHVQSRAVRVRECERCGGRSVVPARIAHGAAVVHQIERPTAASA